jgi:hypothetical protein
LSKADLVEIDCPADVVDRLLWRNAQRILERHVIRLDGMCQWCGRRGPCSPRRLAVRAEAASRRSWHEAWTARNEISRLLPASDTDDNTWPIAPHPRNERGFG